MREVLDAFRKWGHTDLSGDLRDYCFKIVGTDDILFGDFLVEEFVAVPHALMGGANCLNLVLTLFAPFRDAVLETRVELPPVEETEDGVLEPSPLYSDPMGIALRHCNLPIAFVGVLETVALDIGGVVDFELEISLRLGSQLLDSATFNGRGTGQVLIGKPFTFENHDFSHMPRYGRICFELSHIDSGQRHTWTAAIPLVARSGRFVSGRQRVGLFDGNDKRLTQPIPPCPASDADSKMAVTIRIPKFYAPVFFGLWPREPVSADQLRPLPGKDSREEMTKACQDCRGDSAALKSLMEQYGRAVNISAMNPLDDLAPDDVVFLRSQPSKFTKFPELLPWVLRSLDLCAHNIVCRLPDYLDAWVHPLEGSLLAILGGEFVDLHIREFVVRVLETWGDEDINLYLLQLLHALQYSCDDDCPLGLFLLKRALSEPEILGMRFFWGLRSLSGLPWMRQRVLNLTVGFLSYAPEAVRKRCLDGYRFTLSQIKVCTEFGSKDPADRGGLGTALAFRAPVFANFRLPIDPTVLADAYVADQCQIMDSAKKPMLTTYVHAGEGESRREVSTMLKLDDDLMQDQLVLQILSVMDKLWKREGLDLEMKLYRVLPTGHMQGYIEIVRGASTIAKLQATKSTVFGAFEKKVIVDWLKKSHGGSKIPEEVNATFRKSLAAYCVATYVLGVGDRHCSNMMIQPDGHFFHIDFGHFLGHFKKVMADHVDRELEVYFSKAMAYAVKKSGKTSKAGWQEFVDLCGKAFEILRKHKNMLVYLVLSMLGTGIPELQSKEDVKYLSDKLITASTESSATEFIGNLLRKIQKSNRTKANDLAHLIAHSGNKAPAKK
jgi:phosphatidylinositol-4,5-bisphosphate 3-kinase